MPTLTIDDIKVEVPEGTTVLQAARQAGVKIPTLCYLEDVQSHRRLPRLPRRGRGREARWSPPAPSRRPTAWS